MNDDSLIFLERQFFSKRNKQYWLIDVFLESTIKTLVAEEQIYALDDYSRIRNGVKPGDLICFVLVGKGVVAHAEVESSPTYRLHYKVEDPVNYPWVITLKNVHLYLDDPVIINFALLMKVDFRPQPIRCIYRIPYEYMLKEHDYYLLTRDSTRYL